MTERDIAEKNLKSIELEDRLKGARYFALHAKPTDVELLNKCLRKENVAWIKRALERALNKTKILVTTATRSENLDESEPSDEVLRDIKAEAVEEVAGTILHEVSTVIGLIALSASEEIPDYENSATFKNLKQLSQLLEAIRNLKLAAGVPKFSKFDLSTVISESITSLQDRIGTINIELAGPKPFMVEAGQIEMQIAIVNGLRNAIEAVSEFSNTEPPKIIINWGRAGVENYLVILDTGSGFSGNPSDALQLGSTNKADHIGYGLATAQFVMRSLEGGVSVSNNLDGGARFELRWYKDHANTIR